TRFDDFDVEAMPPNRKPRIRAVKTLNGVVERIVGLLNADGLLSEEVTIDKDASFGDRYRALIEPMRSAMAAIRPFQEEDFIAFNPLLWIYKAKGQEWRFEVRRP